MPLPAKVKVADEQVVQTVDEVHTEQWVAQGEQVLSVVRKVPETQTEQMILLVLVALYAHVVQLAWKVLQSWHKPVALLRKYPAAVLQEQVVPLRMKLAIVLQAEQTLAVEQRVQLRGQRVQTE